MPSFLATLRKNLSGVRTRIPAPSPLSGSHPHAPRWFMFSRIVSASVTILCDAFPFMWQMNPTPHASRSYSGRYKPRAAGKPFIFHFLQRVMLPTFRIVKYSRFQPRSQGKWKVEESRATLADTPITRFTPQTLSPLGQERPQALQPAVQEARDGGRSTVEVLSDLSQ